MDLQYSKEVALSKVDNRAKAAIDRARKLLQTHEVVFKHFGRWLAPGDVKLDASSPEYAVIEDALSVVVTETSDLESNVVGYLPQGSAVLIAEDNGSRVRLAQPIVGWCSARSREGFVVIDVAPRMEHSHNFDPSHPQTKMTESILKNDFVEFSKVFADTFESPSPRKSKTQTRPARACHVDTKDAAGLCLLHYAAIHGRSDALKLLLEHGADVNTRVRADDATAHKGKVARNVFENTRRNGDVDDALNGLMKMITTHKQEQGETPLHFSAHFNHPDTMRLLLDYNADIQVRSRLCSTLVLAPRCITEWLAICFTSLCHITQATCHGNVSAQSIATQLGLQEISKILAAARTQEKVRCSFHLLVAMMPVILIPTRCLAQALFRATILGAIDGVQQLLAAKVSANCKEEDGDTPLHVAAGLGNEALVKVLLQAKANVETRDNMGNRAEDDAMDGGHSALHTMLHELRGFGPGGRHSPETELDRLQSHVTRRHEELASHLQQQVSHFESMLCFARRAPQPLHRGLSHTFCNVAVVA